MQQYHVMQVICTTCKNMFIVYAHMAGFPDAIIAEKNFKKYLYTKTNLINLLPINYIFSYIIQTVLYKCTLGCITFVFFSSKKNHKSSYGSPEQNMEPKIFFFFWPSPRFALGVRKYTFKQSTVGE